MTDYQLYARVLRLWHLDREPSATAENNREMHEIVAVVIYPDRTLIWC